MHTLSGHTNAVATVKCQAAEPQIITGIVDVVSNMIEKPNGECICSVIV